MQQPTLRTKETEQRYQDMKDSGALKEGCALCRVPATETFTFWKIIPNEFPYDKVAKRHDMVVPLRHTPDITEEERIEFEEIKKSYINEHYRYILEATTRTKSIPAHYHLHLIELKENPA